MKLFSIKRICKEVNIKGHKGYNIRIYKQFLGIPYSIVLEYYLMRKYDVEYAGIIPIFYDIPITRPRSYFNTNYYNMIWCDKNPIIIGYKVELKTLNEMNSYI